MSSSRLDLGRQALAPAGFPDNAAHLRGEITWVHRLIRSEIGAAGSGPGDPPLDEFAGLYISREEIERYLAPAPAGGEGPGGAEPAVQQLRDEVERARASLDREVELSLSRGVDLRLARLARAFGLDEGARTALVCAVAVELDPRVSRLFAYLQNDATKKRPTVALLARLIARGAADPLGLRQSLGPTSGLFANRLLEASTEVGETVWAAREARPGAGLVEFLLGIDGLPPSPAQLAEIVAPASMIGELAYYRHHRAIVDELGRCRRVAGRLPLSYVAGPIGAGKHLVAHALAAVLGKQLLRAHWGTLRAGAGGLDEAGRILGRDARMRDGLVWLVGVDETDGAADADRASRSALEMLLRGLGTTEVIVTGTAPASELRHRLGLRALAFELPYPTSGERVEIWRRHLAGGGAEIVDVSLLAEKFRFTPGQIARALGVAEMTSPRDRDGQPSLRGGDLYTRCREEAQRGLHLFCQKIDPRFDWADIVLPADTQAQLREICRWVSHRAQVHETWGFGAKLAVGKGVTVLFSGASGTGKTMSAEVIAADLQLDLFRVDLSRIVSKYIGETEKNLSRIFEQGASSSCVLFFDEADALFGKRTEVKDAHDRYANIEVNYLLSEMDRYEGIIIVSTNIKGNLDPAFIRRFSHVVEYPVPNERLREAIWRKAFPAHTPLGADVDFGFLAQRFNLTGGNIKNIALAGAFLAAAEAREVGMEHVICATKREYQKIGRICSKSDFGPYYPLVREADVP